MADVMVFEPQHPFEFKKGPLLESMAASGWMDTELPYQYLRHPTHAELLRAMDWPFIRLGGELFSTGYTAWDPDRRSEEEKLADQQLDLDRAWLQARSRRTKLAAAFGRMFGAEADADFPAFAHIRNRELVPIILKRIRR